MKYLNNLYIVVLSCIVLSCSEAVIDISVYTELEVDIYPDYKGVTIPPNIAPLNFGIDTDKKACAILSNGCDSFVVCLSNGTFNIPPADWRKLLMQTKGQSLQVTVAVEEESAWIAYRPFTIRVASETIDPYMVYRLIAPGYELWQRMGIYQRCLENFKVEAVLENRLTQNNCINCHSFCQQNPDEFLFHMRADLAGTYVVKGDKVKKLNTKTPETISALVYPSWHPSGRYVAFSVNKTQQSFHQNHPNRIEVYDEASDVVIYDVEKEEIVTTKQLFSEQAFETFPTFSPDGAKLYFCSAVASKVPAQYDSVKYSLCVIDFDALHRSFGNKVDTIYNSLSGKSASFPRISPDGDKLVFTLSDYGNFSIWHKDADLYLYNLKNGLLRPLTELNSGDTESYHSWSSNGNWLVFSSRRKDGLYTHPYLAYFAKDGSVGKAFIIPQKDAEYYDRFMQSYNIPELVKGIVHVSKRKIIKAVHGDGINVQKK